MNEYFDNLHTQSLLHNKDLFTDMDIDMMSDETALIMTDILNVNKPSYWEKNLNTRIMDIKGIF